MQSINPSRNNYILVKYNVTFNTSLASLNFTEPAKNIYELIINIFQSRERHIKIMLKLHFFFVAIDFWEYVICYNLINLGFSAFLQGIKKYENMNILIA